MDITVTLKHAVNLDATVPVTMLPNPLLTDNDRAHRIEVSCYRSGRRDRVDLSGAGVRGYLCEQTDLRSSSTETRKETWPKSFCPQPVMLCRGGFRL